MGLHVHFKDGKFAIWSTVVDAYITQWTEDEDMVIADWIGYQLYEHLRGIKQQIKIAREHGCSAGKPVRHSRDEL